LSLIAALPVTSCAGGSLPASPSPVIAVQSAASAAHVTAAPALVGEWRGFVRSSAVRPESGTTVGFALNCSQAWEITTQSGGHFEGRMSSEGNGAESDWRCTQNARFTGQATSGERVTISFVPAFKVGGCTNAEGAETATGSLSRDSIVLALPYRATCDITPVAGPSLDLLIATTITLDRRQPLFPLGVSFAGVPQR
jgi:hypothetical protein